MKMRVRAIAVSTALSVLLAWSAATVCIAQDGGETAFKEAEFFIEFNASAADAGVQVFLDADEWQRLAVSAPDGHTILTVNGKKTLRDLGLTELFFESVEPEIGDLPLTEFLALFPEGEYRFKAITVDRTLLEGEAEFTHAIPCGPEVEPEDGEVLDAYTPVVIGWGEVTEVVDPLATDAAGEVVCTAPETLGFYDFGIETYQVIVENDLGDLVVNLTGSARQLTVPGEMLFPGSLYKFEVLAKEGSGNQTISEGYFCTMPLTGLECETLAEEM